MISYIYRSAVERILKELLLLEEEIEGLMEELNKANMDENEEEQIELDSGYAEEMTPEKL